MTVELRKELFARVGQYANAIGAHGIDSPEARAVRDAYAVDYEFQEYADGLDAVKRGLQAKKDPAKTRGHRAKLSPDFVPIDPADMLYDDWKDLLVVMRAMDAAKAKIAERHRLIVEREKGEG